MEYEIKPNYGSYKTNTYSYYCALVLGYYVFTVYGRLRVKFALAERG